MEVDARHSELLSGHPKLRRVSQWKHKYSNVNCYNEQIEHRERKSFILSIGGIFICGTHLV